MHCFKGAVVKWLEGPCEAYYASSGRPSIPPGLYFRMLLEGYFEGLGSQRGIAWRCSDSLSPRSKATFSTYAYRSIARDREGQYLTPDAVPPCTLFRVNVLLSTEKTDRV